MQKMHQEQMKEKRDKIKQRKARTHRLIIRGAIAEKLIDNAESLSDEAFQEALYELAKKSDVGATGSSPESSGRIRQEASLEDPITGSEPPAGLSESARHHTLVV